MPKPALSQATLVKPVSIAPTGRRADWKKTTLVEGFRGGLVSIEDGTLFFTYLDGRVVMPSNVANEYLKPIDMAVVAGELYVLDGTTLYLLSNTGNRTRVGEENAAPALRFLAEYDGELWGIEQDGTLHRADENGVWTTVGSAEGVWPDVSQFFSFKGQLYALVGGTLYRCDREVNWQPVGAVGAWSAINYMVPLRNRIWMSGNSNMIAVDAAGRKTLIGKGRWPRLDALVALNGALVSIDSGGQIAVTTTR